VKPSERAIAASIVRAKRLGKRLDLDAVERRIEALVRREARR
jgi:hypothetical protein